MAGSFSKKYNMEEFKSLITDKSGEIQVVFSDFKIENFEFPVKKIESMHFKDTEWKKINAESRLFKNIIFEDCELNSVDFRNSTLDNVLFKNCTLKNIVMNKANIKNMVFDGCNITGDSSDIENSYVNITADYIYFKKSKISALDFYHSKANFVFDDSQLNNISGYGLKSGSSITFAHSNAFDVDFSNSVLTSLIIKDSTIKESKINGASIGEIILDNNEFFRFPIASNKTYGTITARMNTEIKIRGSGPVKNVIISDCTEYKDIYIAKMKFDNADIQNCKSPRFIFFETKGKKMTVSNMEVGVFDLEDAEIDHLILENIVIENKIYMENARVNNYEAHNVTVIKGVEIKDKGANFKIISTH